MMREKVKIAAVQMNPKIMKKRHNLDHVLINIKAAAGNGADLIVFPECALTGYVFRSREEAVPFMETVPGSSTKEIGALCKELGVHAVVGLLEKDGAKCYNTAVLVGPEGLIGKYQKNHLPFLGIDRFLDPGNRPFEVFDTPVGRLGIHICYDATFPESARIMTLLGADILILPTNWPQGRGKVVKYVINTRAYENKVHFVAVDRVGEERGTRFIGNSKIVDARGDTLVQAGSEKEEIIYAEVSLADARQKRVVFKPGEFEMDFIRDRRPELYGAIVSRDTSSR
ncbi:MAG TPA: carbon-nitrogen hydrolase family protein [Dehalococcoidia bacterium]